MTTIATAEEPVIQLIRWVSDHDVDYTKVGEPMTRTDATAQLAGMSDEMRTEYDLMHTVTGRLVSWVLPL